MGSNRRVVNFSDRFINFGVSVLLMWYRSSCHAFGPSPLQSFVSIRILRLSRNSTKYAQLSYFLSFVPASVPFSTFSTFFVKQNPSNRSSYTESLLPCRRTGDTAKVDLSLTNSNKSPKKQKEVTETKMRSAKQEFLRR